MRRALSVSLLLLSVTVQQACQRDEATAPQAPRASAQAMGVSASMDGSAARIVFTSRRDGKYQIYLMNADGSDQTRLTRDTAEDHHPSVSPDGRRIAFTSNRDGNEEIYVMTGDGAPPTRLTNNQATDTDPDWSPDGRQIVFVSARDGGPWQIYVMNADGSAQTRLTNDACTSDTHPRWSPDGQKIAFTADCGPRDGTAQIYVMNPDGSALTRLTNELTHNTDPSWSPDGRIVFASGGGISMMAADGSGRTRVTDQPGDDPSSSPDGRQIVFSRFVSPSNTEIFVMSADGSGQTRLTNNPAFDFLPGWAPRDPSPQLALPTDITAPATRLNGAVVEYTASATDPTDPNPAVACTPVSGTRFPIGTTSVQCTASDGAWNTVTGAFRVIVQNADEQLAAVASELQAIVAANPGTPLAKKAEDARADVESARQQLAQTPDYRTGPLGQLKLAVGALTGAVEGGLLSAAQGNALMDRTANAARLLAESAIAAAVARGGNEKDIAEAERALVEGDNQRAAGQYQDAVAQYENASKHAEDHGRAPTQLAFLTEPPASVEATVAMAPAVRVVVQDAFGGTVPNATTVVTVALAANSSGATLGGTTTVDAVDGIATLADLSVDRPGSAYTLTATAAGLSGTTSSPFAVQLTLAMVSVGADHRCGVTTRGAAYCWGSNWSGQLGDGTTTDRASPAPVSGGHRFAAVSSGANYSCGVTTSGAAYCWGHNGFGQLGDGTTTPRAAPVAVGGGLSFGTVDAGTFHTCGVSTSGAAYCWGNNFFGMLGDGTTIDRPAPTPVAGGLSFASVSSGESYACGVTTGGAAYCWGFNRWGQLGTGNTANATSGPVPVEGGLSFTTISAAGDHTCGVTTGGAGYCWGANTFGQLGYGTSTGLQQCFDPSRFSVPCTTVPVAVAGGLSFAAVTNASSETTCAVAASGAAYCWGNNAGGALGVGTSTGPEQCTIPPRGVRSACSTVPVAVAGGLSLSSVSSAGFASSNSSGGLTYTCGVTPSGAAYCWGLGTSTPTPVTPLGSSSAGIAAK